MQRFLNQSRIQLQTDQAKPEDNNQITEIKFSDINPPIQFWYELDVVTYKNFIQV